MFIGQENGKSRLQQTQDEVEEVKVIMLDNLNKAEERSGKLGDLEDRAAKMLDKVCRVGSGSWKVSGGSLCVAWIRRITGANGTKAPFPQASRD